MSISELNHLMTYVLDGWMLFSAGFIGIGFISFVSKRIQEDLEAEALALTQAEAGTLVETDGVSVTKAVESTVAPVNTTPSPELTTPPANKTSEITESFTHEESDTPEPGSLEIEEDDAEVARLTEVAAVSKKLAKTKRKQAGTSSVSVST